MAAPVITSATPTHGASLGGIEVTIAGTDFDEPAPVTVTVGGATVVPLSRTATRIVIETPPHAVGAVDIVVTNADGHSTLEDGHTYVLAPVVISLTPDSGLTRGGNMVAIVGQNFRLPPAPAAAGYLGGPAPQTVRVTFDGVAAPWAEAASERLIYATVPIWQGPQSAGMTWPIVQDVRVANLDDDGVELPGEYIVAAESYSITRPELAAECVLMRVVRELMQLLKRHVIDNVALSLGRDYDDDPAAWERLRASAPSLRLVGPNTELNRLYSLNRVDDEVDPDDPTRWLRTQVPVTVDLDFGMRGYATSPTAVFAMSQAVLLLFRDNVRLGILRDPLDESAGRIEYEVEVTWEDYPSFTMQPNASDLYWFDARVLIRGVHLDDDSATVVRRGWIVSSNEGDPTLEVQGNV